MIVTLKEGSLLFMAAAAFRQVDTAKGAMFSSLWAKQF